MQSYSVERGWWSNNNLMARFRDGDYEDSTEQEVKEFIEQIGGDFEKVS